MFISVRTEEKPAAAINDLLHCSHKNPWPPRQLEYAVLFEITKITKINDSFGTNYQPSFVVPFGPIEQ